MAMEFSLTNIVAGVAAAILVAWLTRDPMDAAQDGKGWRHLGPGIMHRCALWGSIALVAFFLWILLFVGSSRPDGAEQMQILKWLTVAFGSGAVIMIFGIRQVIRHGIAWRGTTLAFNGSTGSREQRSLSEVADVRRDWLGRLAIIFKDGVETRLDIYSRGAEPLIRKLEHQLGRRLD